MQNEQPNDNGPLSTSTYPNLLPSEELLIHILCTSPNLENSLPTFFLNKNKKFKN